MVFILPKFKLLSTILTKEWVPDFIQIICDGGTAQSISKSISDVIDMEGLEVLQPRLRALHKALLDSTADLAELPKLEEVDAIPLSGIIDLKANAISGKNTPGVIIKTSEGVTIRAFEGSEILIYDDEDELNPFSRTIAKDLQSGDEICILGDDFIEAAREKLNLTATAADTVGKQQKFSLNVRI
jgi:hypothetical protein